jgi:hypothetical protein
MNSSRLLARAIKLEAKGDAGLTVLTGAMHHGASDMPGGIRLVHSISSRLAVVLVRSDYHRAYNLTDRAGAPTASLERLAVRIELADALRRERPGNKVHLSI